MRLEERVSLRHPSGGQAPDVVPDGSVGDAVEDDDQPFAAPGQASERSGEIEGDVQLRRMASPLTADPGVDALDDAHDFGGRRNVQQECPAEHAIAMKPGLEPPDGGGNGPRVEEHSRRQRLTGSRELEGGEALTLAGIGFGMEPIVAAGEAQYVGKQNLIATKLNWIDRWGKTFTVVTLIYFLILLLLVLYEQ